jgi:hypothetical protein
MGMVWLLLSPLAITSLAHAQQNAAGQTLVFRPDPFTTLRMPAVQKDLKLSEEQIKQVREATEKYADIEKQLRAQRVPGQPPRPEYNQKVEEMLTERDAAAAKILNADQAKRLRQIERQELGGRAFTNSDLAADLGLTEAQQQSVREINFKFNRRYRDTVRAKSGGSIRELNKEWDEELLKLLTPAQTKKWGELKGPPLVSGR